MPPVPALLRAACDYFVIALQALPVLIGGMIWLIVAFIIQTGSKNKTWKDYSGTMWL